MTSSICLLSLIWVFVFSYKGETNTRGKEIISRFSDQLNELSWESKEWDASDNIKIVGELVQSENEMSVLSFWNTDSLYFFFKVKDKDLRAYQDSLDHPRLFLDDMVEILLDPANNKDSCWNKDDIVYHVNLLKVKKDDRGAANCKSDTKWNGNAEIQIKILGTLNDTIDRDQGYLMSIVFTWQELGQSPQLGVKMGVNFANGDNDGKGRQLFDWVGAWPIRSPYAFGTLLLKN